MTFVFGDNAAVPPERLEAAFVIECARQGVLTNGNILPSLAHDEDAVGRTAEAFAPALEAVAKLIAAGGEAVSHAMQAGFARGNGRPAVEGMPAAFLDSARDEGRHLVVRGWMLSGEAQPCTVEVAGPRGTVRIADRVERPDLIGMGCDARAAAEAGFSVALAADEFVVDGRYVFELRGRVGDNPVFSCPVTRPTVHGALDLSPSRVNAEGVLEL
jgi:hypothetical protein